MNTMGLPPGGPPSPRPETTDEKRRRIASEAAGIADARADIAAGRVVDAAEVDAWIDSLDTGHELPVPYSGR